MDTFKEWMLEKFGQDELRDLAQYGAAGGFSGLIYYHETTALYDEYEDEILEMITERAEEEGLTYLEFVARCKGAKDVGDNTQFKNLIVWIAAEMIAWQETCDPF